MFRFFSFVEASFYNCFFSFTMVAWTRFRELREESAIGDRPASSMFKFMAGMNTDLGRGSFWVDREIPDAKHVDRCS